MTKTIADALRAETRLETVRENLVRLLRLRFGDLPAETIALIESTKSLRRLNGWLDLVVTARTLKQVGIE